MSAGTAPPAGTARTARTVARAAAHGAVTALLVLGGTLALAGTAGAADEPAPTSSAACGQTSDDYGGGEVCSVEVLEATPVCTGDVALLRYRVEGVGTGTGTVTATWVQPGGAGVTVAGLGTSGELLWPGMVVENGKAVDWPGWTRTASGGWVAGDAYSWAAGTVTLRLALGGAVASVQVTYPAGGGCGPAESEVKAVDPTVTTVSAVLARTGAEVWPVVAAAGVLLLAGAGGLLVARRRRG